MAVTYGILCCTTYANNVYGIIYEKKYESN